MYRQTALTKKPGKKLISVGIMKATQEKSRIQIQICRSVVHFCGPGSVPKCHTTLIITVPKFIVLLRELQCKAGHEVGLSQLRHGVAHAL
jgi:hypothetical protein